MKKEMGFRTITPRPAFHVAVNASEPITAQEESAVAGSAYVDQVHRLSSAALFVIGTSSATDAEVQAAIEGGVDDRNTQTPDP